MTAASTKTGIVNALRYAVLFLLYVSTSHADTMTGRVIKIADGDTLTKLDASNIQYKIRFSGIDAPERDQPFGAASKKHLSQLAAGKMAEAHCHKQDCYKRSICFVYVNGEDVALAQIHAGLAWVYRKYLNELAPKYQSEYLSAEDRAAADRVGLWRDDNPEPPWEWRRREER